MITYLKTVLRPLRIKSDVNKKDLKKFSTRIRSSHLLIREENPQDHLCTFYIPVDKKDKKLYLVIHRKSGLWMPPGGHIDKNEFPYNTVQRECQEELNYTIFFDQIEFFNLSIDPIDNPLQLCKVHYSLWYLVNTGRQKFHYNEESLDGRWVTLPEAQKLVVFPAYKQPIASLSYYLGI